MNKNVIKGSRKIKFVDKTYKKGDLYLHPLTLTLEKVDKDKITPTEGYIDPVKKQYRINIEKDNINFSDYEIQKYMSLPYLNLNYEIILNYYDALNLHKLNNIIKLKINNNHPPKNIIRIINMWIKDNLFVLQKSNNYIVTLFRLINDKYYKLEHNPDNVKKYIDKWLNTKNINDFEFNLFDDIFNYIKK
tara:strand:- start:8030 stop:8599 length:570 start_codon:yes stop_codon:yes gene_type:complete